MALFSNRDEPGVQRQVVGWRLQKQHDSMLVVEALNHAMLTTEERGRCCFTQTKAVFMGVSFIRCVKQHGLDTKYESPRKLLG
ncbi:hypothetical protein INT80_15335 [Gallibacterium anatis]|uniref:Uncharacterized protein n=1 Tax=Gallibacterium anatis TaxID=750 RepID=A0A930UYQ4_9PAST|nr:hypothetical protein [Gallibacterium anatis]